MKNFFVALVIVSISFTVFAQKPTERIQAGIIGLTSEVSNSDETFTIKYLVTMKDDNFNYSERFKNIVNENCKGCDLVVFKQFYDRNGLLSNTTYVYFVESNLEYSDESDSITVAILPKDILFYGDEINRILGLNFKVFLSTKKIHEENELNQLKKIFLIVD